MMCMNNRTAASGKFSEGTILLVSETQLKEVDAYRQQVISPGLSIGNLVELIRDDRALLPFNRHVFLSKDEWYRHIFWPLHAVCSDTPLKLEPESNNPTNVLTCNNLQNRSKKNPTSTSTKCSVHSSPPQKRRFTVALNIVRF